MAIDQAGRPVRALEPESPADLLGLAGVSGDAIGHRRELRGPVWAADHAERARADDLTEIRRGLDGSHEAAEIGLRDALRLLIDDMVAAARARPAIWAEAIRFRDQRWVAPILREWIAARGLGCAVLVDVEADGLIVTLRTRDRLFGARASRRLAVGAI